MARMPIFQTVLHVDDDDDVRTIVGLALSMNSRLTVVQRSSGPEAVELCKNFRPDLLLLDLMMPGMTGEEAWAKIRKIPGLSEVPAVFLTAKADSQTNLHLLANGALGVIAKPFNPIEISKRLDDIWVTAFE
jgi:CheY-like chemotaxis protein